MVQMRLLYEIRRPALVVLLLPLLQIEDIRGQLKVDSIYSIVVSPHTITDVVSSNAYGEYLLLFVEQQATESRILLKQFSDESDLLEPPVVFYSDTGVIRHPFSVETHNYENQLWVRREYFFWEQHTGDSSAVMIMRRDSAQWLSPVRFFPSPLPQTEFTVSASQDASEISLAWIENDSVSLVLFGSDSIRFHSRLKLDPDRTCRNLTVFYDRNRARTFVVWEERAATSLLALASLSTGNYSITVDTLTADGDNVLPRFILNPIFGTPSLLWSKRDTTATNLYLWEDLPGTTFRPLTEDTIGSNFPGSVFTLPIIIKRGLGKTSVGDIFAYHRVLEDSQAVVRNRMVDYGIRVQDEYWTAKELFSVDITQGFYTLPLIFWVEKDSTLYSLKALPTDVFMVSARVPQETPRMYRLHQNYPNPFNPTTTIRYQLWSAGPVQLKVFDLLGQEVATLVTGNFDAGEYNLVWNAGELPGGVYVLRLIGEGFAESRKLLMLK